MDWKIFFTVFGAVFAAELADKTQLVSIIFASKTAKPFTVWLSSVCAYMLVTIISVLAGVLLAKYIKPEIIKYTGAGLFILIGALMFLGKL
ncbi:MAG: TMEM165/GDT1 family protein [Candidatus Omnitrophota bacterium]